MPTLAEQARVATKAGEARIAAERAAAAKKDAKADRKLQADAKKRAARLFSEANDKIAEATAKGQRSTYLPVMSYERDSRPAWAVYLSRETQKLLVAAGFKVTEQSVKDVPFGSDPLFPWTVYSIGIKIDW